MGPKGPGRNNGLKRRFPWILYDIFLRLTLRVSKEATTNRLLVPGRDYSCLWKPLRPWGAGALGMSRE